MAGCRASPHLRRRLRWASLRPSAGSGQALKTGEKPGLADDHQSPGAAIFRAFESVEKQPGSHVVSVVISAVPRNLMRAGGQLHSVEQALYPPPRQIVDGQ